MSFCITKGNVDDRQVVEKLMRGLNGLCDVRKKLAKIFQSKEDKDIDDRFDMESFLDFLETLSYFANEGYIKLEDVDQLQSGVICNTREIFNDWINELRKNDSEVYAQLLQLCRKLSEKK